MEPPKRNKDVKQQPSENQKCLMIQHKGALVHIPYFIITLLQLSANKSMNEIHERD